MQTHGILVKVLYIIYNWLINSEKVTFDEAFLFQFPSYLLIASCTSTGVYRL